MITRNKLIAVLAIVAVSASAQSAAPSARPVDEVAPDDPSAQCGIFQDWWENDFFFRV